MAGRERSELALERRSSGGLSRRTLVPAVTAVVIVVVVAAAVAVAVAIAVVACRCQKMAIWSVSGEWWREELKELGSSGSNSRRS
tara:strand:+ start:618 stop:872 length:255 start_codon:yes stop_codon:yes gene_type:complete